MGTLDDTGSEQGERPVIVWSAAHRPKRGEVASGDHYVVRPEPERTLLGIIDGLGHGTAAALAAGRAVDVLRESLDGETLISLMQRCHAALQRTRGAVMGLAECGTRQAGMRWLGVGNIEGVIVRAGADAPSPVTWLHSRGGIVGHRLPHLLVSTVPLNQDDVVVLVTDGISHDFATSLATDIRLPGLADRILAQYGKEADDALVLVVRYARGGSRGVLHE